MKHHCVIRLTKYFMTIHGLPRVRFILSYQIIWADFTIVVISVKETGVVVPTLDPDEIPFGAIRFDFSKITNSEMKATICQLISEIIARLVAILQSYGCDISAQKALLTVIDVVSKHWINTEMDDLDKVFTLYLFNILLSPLSYCTYS